MSSFYRVIVLVAAAALVVAAILSMRPGEEPESETAPMPTQRSNLGQSGSPNSEAAQDSPGFVFEDRPQFPEETEFGRVPNPGGEDPHTIRRPELDVPILTAPLDEGALQQGSQRPATATTVEPRPNRTVGGGAIATSNGGPGGSEFFEPGMPPEFGAPRTGAAPEDLRGIDVVVSAPEAEGGPAVEPVAPEASDPGIDYPAPEADDPGIEYPAPEDSGY